MTPSLGDARFVVLAGGLGTRLRPVVADRPKGLAPIGDQPFLRLLLRMLVAQGARRFVLCVGHLAEQIQRELGDGRDLGASIDYSVETTLLGTGGALKLAERYFDPRAIVINGDTYFDVDYAALLQAHLATRAEATIAVSHVEDAGRFGSIELDGDVITGFREKDDSGAGWVNAGVYVVERSLLAAVPADKVRSFERDVLPGAVAGRMVRAYRSDGGFYDIGTPASLAEFQAFAATRLAEG